MLRRGIGAWSSRRVRTRARRALIRERIQAAAVGAAVEAELEVELQLEEDEGIDDRLLERISVYTHSQAPHPAVTGSLRSTVTGPGSAAPTTHTENV